MTTVDNSRFMALSQRESQNPVVDTPRVLHVCLEGPNAVVGGPGVVLEGLLSSFDGTGVKTHAVTPFYAYMKSMKDYQNLELIGKIKHIYDHQEVFSMIYKAKVCDGKLTQYLIEPDEKFKDLFALQAPKNLYDCLPSAAPSTPITRSHYVSSAVAAFAANYSGKKGSKNIAALHFHNTTFVAGAILTKQEYNPLRILKKLPPVKITFHFHHGAVVTPYQEQTTDLKAYGIKKPPIGTFTYDQQVEAWRHADGLGFVSKATLEAAKAVAQPQYKMVIEELNKKGGLFTLSNGIYAKEYCMQNKARLGPFALDLTSNTEAYPVLTAKQKAKQALCDAGVISDPNKPLFFFVGRFCEDKGMELLAKAAEDILKKGGNLILMGSGDEKMPPVKRLIELSNLYPGSCTILSSFDAQRKPLGTTGIAINDMTRIAADYSLMTSRLEGCPLTALENLAAGSILLTTLVGGIPAFIYDESHPQFNAYPFAYHPHDFNKTCQGAFLAIDKAFALAKLPLGQKEPIYRQLAKASYAHDWEKSTTEAPRQTLTTIYKKIFQNSAIIPIIFPNPTGLIGKVTGFLSQCWLSIKIITTKFLTTIHLLILRLKKGITR